MGKRILINLWRQVLIAFEGNGTIYTFDCVSGDARHPTEEVEEFVPGKGIVKHISGNVVKHKVIRKQHPCHSTKYNAQMNYALFFTNDGKAIHQGEVVEPLSYLKTGFGLLAGVGGALGPIIGSHGCVRLSKDNAEKLYTWASIGTSVIIVGHANEFWNSLGDKATLEDAGVPHL